MQEAIEDSPTQDSTETYIIDEWYTAEEAGCASEEVLCTVHPGIVTIGENTWKVQACASQECGLWSEPMNFDFTAINKSSYTDNGDGTVYNNYNLTWTKQMTRMDSEREFKLVPPKREITIMDPLKHTSGLAYGFFASKVKTMYKEAGIHSRNQT